jgi:5-methyltetrahydropteroyltriglutamate--homocysteine methyltransferase
MDTILPTTLVGSYPQPDWLIDRAKLGGRFHDGDDRLSISRFLYLTQSQAGAMVLPAIVALWSANISWP